LASDADLPREKAPFVAGKAFTVTARIRRAADAGVLVAQGGSSHGYSLYVEDGKLHFATCHGGQRSVVSAGVEPLPDNTTVTANLSASGEVTLNVNESEVGRGKFRGPLIQMPVDGLQVGEDRDGAVGRYQTPFAFQGEIEGATVVID
jgi:arylsulfatase